MSTPPTPPRTVTLKDAAAFFLPLIFMAELMMITHSIIHAWLARGIVPTVSLAAFSIAFAVNTLFSSAFRSMHPIALSFVNDRASLLRVWSFGMVLAVLAMGFVLASGVTPLGIWIYGGLLGAGPDVVEQAQAASLIFAFIFPLQCTRNVGAGLLMVRRRTLLISYGTGVRVLSLGVLLIALSGSVHGASLGAGALVGCIAVETTFVLLAARRYYRELPASSGPLPGYGVMWHFSWPLVANAMMENSLIVLVNVFVGRLPNADQSLAAFGVTRGLLMLMMSPLRNLAQTAQALTRTREDLRVLTRFSRGTLGVSMALIALLFLTPLRGVVLGSVMGLEPGLQATVEPAVLLLIVTPPLWGLSALYRGLLSGARQTGVLAVTGTVRLAAVIAVCLVGVALPGTNGAVMGIAALASAFLCETLLLGRSLSGVLRQGSAYPTAETQPGIGTPAPSAAD